jgi:hypothetical protein
MFSVSIAIRLGIFNAIPNSSSSAAPPDPIIYCC